MKLDNRPLLHTSKKYFIVVVARESEVLPTRGPHGSKLVYDKAGGYGSP